MYYETIHTDKVAGFDIVFSVTPEDIAPERDFDSEDDRRDLIERIEDGRLVWFIARVQAFKNGVLLSTDYLGGCCYETYMQFIEEAYYYQDMVETVVTEAKEAIKKLTD